MTYLDECRNLIDSEHNWLASTMHDSFELYQYLVGIYDEVTEDDAEELFNEYFVIKEENNGNDRN